MSDWKKIQIEEAKTWLIEDPIKRQEKLQREIARYPRMAKQMWLNIIDTSNMFIFDIGGGPVGLSSILPHARRVVIDPLKIEYAKFFNTHYHFGAKAENLKQLLSDPDLVIVTNALDHFDEPEIFLDDLVEYLKPGAYFAHFHAINNAITHKHKAHEYNFTPEILHNFIDKDFETVWELNYPDVRYGWKNYNGKVGQPAFCGLYRKVTGYEGGE